MYVSEITISYEWQFETKNLINYHFNSSCCICVIYVSRAKKINYQDLSNSFLMLFEVNSKKLNFQVGFTPYNFTI